MTQDTDREPRKSTINPPVFFISAGLILAVSVYAVLFPGHAETVFAAVQGSIVQNFGWFYMLAVALFLIFVIGVAISRYGQIRLGADDSVPPYSYTSWFAMLFSAGMGIGLVFFGVAEPILHYADPPSGEGGTVASAREAMRIAFFHWGVHAWAIYALVGLAIAFFSFRHKMPLTIRSALYPILGERIYGPAGHAVDIFAVLGTLFGVATSLGLGVLQVNAGLDYLFGIPFGTPVQIILIAVITLMATGSVVAGLDAGIKRLSELNLLLALLLLLFVLVAGPTLFLLEAFVQNTGYYLSQIVDMTFRLYAYEPNDWIGGWTLFYWGWWIAWSPFVGMFIARVSEGRTVREFIVGVLLVPAGFTFLWLTFFGNTAIFYDMGSAAGAISAAARDNVPVALFAMLKQLPLSQISSFLGTLLVVTFFVTSSDSGSLVIDMITSGGAVNSPVWQRVFWALTEGLVAAALLLAGGLNALQTASIAAALPFAVIMLFMAYGLMKGLRMEAGRKMVRGFTPPALPVTGSPASWQTRLTKAVRHYRRNEVARFLSDTVAPAMESVAAELRQQGLDVEIDREDSNLQLRAAYEGHTEFIYRVEMREYAVPSFAFPELPDKEREAHHYRAEVFLLEGPEHYNIMGYSKDQVIADIVSQFEKHMHFLHLAPS